MEQLYKKVTNKKAKNLRRNRHIYDLDLRLDEFEQFLFNASFLIVTIPITVPLYLVLHNTAGRYLYYRQDKCDEELMRLQRLQDICEFSLGISNNMRWISSFYYAEDEIDTSVALSHSIEERKRILTECFPLQELFDINIDKLAGAYFKRLSDPNRCCPMLGADQSGFDHSVLGIVEDINS